MGMKAVHACDVGAVAIGSAKIDRSTTATLLEGSCARQRRSMKAREAESGSIRFPHFSRLKHSGLNTCDRTPLTSPHPAFPAAAPFVRRHRCRRAVMQFPISLCALVPRGYSKAWNNSDRPRLFPSRNEAWRGPRSFTASADFSGPWPAVTSFSVQLTPLPLDSGRFEVSPYSFRRSTDDTGSARPTPHLGVDTSSRRRCLCASRSMAAGSQAKAKAEVKMA